MSPPTDPATARRFANMLVASLEKDDPELLRHLRQAPFETVSSWPEITFKVYDLGSPAARGSRCSVYGYYLEHRQPREIGVARAASTRRMNFTALHELGHHLQPDHPEVGLALAQLDDEWRTLEDRICDAFAAEVLLPDDVVSSLLAAEHLGPTAAQVVELFHASDASRAACCVRAAQHLRVDGWVILADREGRVIFAAGANHPFRLAPGTPQPDTSTVALAGRTGAAQGLSTVTYASGKTSPHFNTDAIVDGDYVFAVLSLGATPWNPQPVPKGLQRPNGVPSSCLDPGCDHEWVSFDDPCDKCGERECPRCGRCACVPVVERRLCTECYLPKPVGLFAEGSEICSDCR